VARVAGQTKCGMDYVRAGRSSRRASRSRLASDAVVNVAMDTMRGNISAFT